jgi:glycosyltransferase involved in cell wall biosynthesis
LQESCCKEIESDIILKTNITYIISNINKALAFEWVSAYLNKDKFNLNFILLNPGDSVLESYLKQNNIQVDRITFISKKNIPKAIYETCKILKRHQSHIVHTHLFDANMVGLLAAWFVGVPKRIHTRHHSDFHHIYHPKAIKYDKLVNRLSTDIVAISKLVKDILIKKESVSPEKVHLIHHGFKLEDFKNVPASAISLLKQKYLPNDSAPVIGVISRYTEWKGIQYIIPAFETLLKTHPSAFLILANASGSYDPTVKKMLQKLPGKNYVEIPFEDNIFALYQLFDLFIHVPISESCEAFGQTYVEALTAGIPSVFTLSGIANELIVDRHNALVVPYQNSDAIYHAMKEVLGNRTLVNHLIANGQKDTIDAFDLRKMILSLERLYAK